MHIALGYRFSCTTCLLRTSSTDNATVTIGPRQTTSTTCDPLVHTQDDASGLLQVELLSPGGTGSSDGVRELSWQPVNSLIANDRAIMNRTRLEINTYSQDDWLQTFAHVDEIDPGTIVDSVLNGWEIQEPDNRLNSFFQASPSTHTTTALNMHSVTTACNTRFPHASQQVFNRVSVELPYESAIFSLVQCGDVDGTRALLTSGKTSLNAIDPYGLGLLYVSSFKGALSGCLTVNTSMPLTIAGEATALLSLTTCVRP